MMCTAYLYDVAKELREVEEDEKLSDQINYHAYQLEVWIEKSWIKNQEVKK